MTNVGAIIGMGLSTMYPGSGPTDQLVRTVVGAAAGNMVLSIVGKLPKPDQLLRYMFPKPNAVMISQYGPIFQKLEHFIINKYLEQIRSCELQPRNGEINLSLNELQLHKPLIDKFVDAQGEEKEVLLTLIDGRRDPSQTASSWKSLFWNLESWMGPIGNGGSGGSGRTGYEDDDLGKVILVSSWKMNVAELKEYITKISEYNASALITKMFCAIEKDKNRLKAGSSKKGNDFVDIILDWEELHIKSNKRMSNTIVSSDVQKKLFDDVKWFMSAETWYNDKGLPYKRGYLLSGPPGTGKTSLIKAIAAEYKMKVFIIDLEIVKTNAQFSSLMKKINYLCKNQPYILALEDVDRCALFEEKQTNRWGWAPPNSKKDTLSMGCFLNEIDGLVESHGRLLFLTANSPETMMSMKALMRPGRIDKQVTVDYCDFDQIQRLLLHFYGLEWECLKTLDVSKMKEKKITPAEVIAILQGAVDADPKTILHHFFTGFDEHRVLSSMTPAEVEIAQKQEETDILEKDSKIVKYQKNLSRQDVFLKNGRRQKNKWKRILKEAESGNYLEKVKKQFEYSQKNINRIEKSIKRNKELLKKRREMILAKAKAEKDKRLAADKKSSAGKAKRKRSSDDSEYVPPQTRRQRT